MKTIKVLIEMQVDETQVEEESLPGILINILNAHGDGIYSADNAEIIS